MHQLIISHLQFFILILQKKFIYIKLNIRTYIFPCNITYNSDTTNGQDITNSNFLYSFI